MKNTLLALTLLLSSFSFGQVHNWHQLPDAPLVQGPGSNAARSGDISIAEDGRIYTAYMFDNGSGIKLFVDEYIQGTGWSNLYMENTYAVHQTIKSRKNGSTIYFNVYMGDGSGNPVWKTYTANAGTVTQYASFMLPGYQTTTGVDFEMGTNPSYGYLLYQLTSGTGLQLSRIDYGTSTVTSQAVTLPGSVVPSTFDMTVAGDSVFMAISVQNPSYKAYFLKAGPLANVIVPYSSTAVNGEILNPGSVSSNTFLINSDGIGKVHISAYDFGNIASMERIYENGVLSPATYIGTIPENYSLGATYGLSDNMFLFNNYSPSNSGPYKTYVVTHKLSTNVFDTIGTPGNYILAMNSPSEHRLSYSDNKKRFAASFYDPTLLKRSYYLTNSVPYVGAGSIDAGNGMCELQSSTVFNNIGITDDNGDFLTIIGFQSSDVSVLDPSTIGSILTGTAGNTSNYYIYGTPSQPGTVTISVQVTDGWDTVLIALPAVNAVSPAPPSYNTTQISLCSGQGDINLYDYVSQPGGIFYINSLEIDFPNAIFPTNASPLSAEDLELLTYDYSDGICQYYTDVDIIFHNSPTVSVTNTPTNCGQSTGTATALVSGGTTPYAFSQWSSGQQNTNNVSGLGAGQYTYMVVDANACAVTNYFNVLSAGANATGNVTNVSCHGESDGAIAITTNNMTAPIVSLWSSGHSTLSLTGVPAGNYTVDLSDAAGCTISKTFVITQPDALSTDVDTYLPNCQQADGTMEVGGTTGGTTPYTYSWSNGDTGPISNNIAYGIYSLTTMDNHGCQFINTLYMSEQGAADLHGTVTPANCGTSEGAINVTPAVPAGENVVSIMWSNGETTEDIEDLIPTVYICTLVTTNNCTALKAWDIPVVAPLRNDICVVTVDSATTTNLVVWEKLQTTGIAYYTIYRESSVQGEFILIDTVEATNISLFNDVVASPTVRSWRYKIGAVNGCGMESELSHAHQTIHLDVLDNGGSDVTINWNEYQGAAFSNYVVSRYTDANGWEVLGSVPPAQLTYSDTVSITTMGLDYMVEIELDETCTALLWKAQDFNSSRSNKDKAQFNPGEGTGDSNNGIDESYLSSINVSPNPTTDVLHIRQTEAKKVAVLVRTVEGQLMQTFVASSMHDQLDMSTYANGIYFVTLSMNNAQQTLRIVKQ